MNRNLVSELCGSLGKDILSEGSEVGGCLACSRNSKEDGVAVTK